MASLPDFGLVPEEPEEQKPRRRRYAVTDESGARPLPAGAYEPYDVDPLDEEVELPGVSRHAGTFFGIGIGLGIAVLAVVAGLYLGGWVGRPRLAPSPPMTELWGDVPALDEFLNDEALARARLAEAVLSAPPATAPTDLNSPDIRVVDETPNAPQSQAPQAPPAPARNESQNLSNELDNLERSLPPRGPVPPDVPNDERVAPVPAPAQPTAPAETSAPDTIPPRETSPLSRENPY